MVSVPLKRREDIDHRPSAPQVLGRQLVRLRRQVLSCHVFSVERCGLLAKGVSIGLHCLTSHGRAALVRQQDQLGAVHVAQMGCWCGDLLAPLLP